MNKKILVFTMVILFLLPALYSPQIPSLSSAPPTIGNELGLQEDFVLSADGDESPESITSFSETSADDEMRFLDVVSLLETDGSTTSNWVLQGGLPNYYHHRDLSVVAEGEDSNSVAISALVDTFETEDYQAYGWEIHDIYGGWGLPTEEGQKISIRWRNNDSDHYARIKVEYYTGVTLSTRTFVEYETSTDFKTSTIDVYTGHPYIYSVWVWAYENVDDTDVWCSTIIDWIIVYYDNVTGSNPYHEPFVDDSDWVIVVGNAISTDGDVITIPHVGDSGWDTYECDIPSLTGTNFFVEWRIKWNADAGTNNVYFQVDTEDDWSGDTATPFGYQATIPSTWTTYKALIEQDIESVRIALTSGAADSFLVDYIRIAPADEMGWQHDGSITEGVEAESSASWDFDVSSDGDILTLFYERTGTGSDHWGNIYIKWDATTTGADIELDYYPFFGIQYRVIERNGITTSYPLASPQTDGFRDVNNGIGCDSVSWTTEYLNMKAMTTATGNQFVDMWVYSTTEGHNITIEIDWLKAFSIANFTVTQDSDIGTDEYLYVDSDDLVFVIDGDDSDYFRIEYDPDFSVTNTFTVANLTISNIGVGSYSHDYTTRFYVSGWKSWTYDETRFALPSGTVTNVNFHCYDSLILCAIKFIEDGTAPDADIVVSPNPPDDDEQVTLSSIVFDTVEVWEVIYNAISYPIGFSDIDFEATEGQENYWSYSFTSLIAGDYCFKVVANDGANNSTITQANRDYATTRFTVREAAIIVEEITLIGAGEDFTMMTFSARINRDCTYTIYEESASSPESDTYTGSVTAPSFNLAWGKLDVDDPNVNFTIVFVSGALSYNYTSQYQIVAVAQIVVTTYTLFGAGSDFTYIQYSGHITHDCSFTIEEWSDTWGINETHSGSVSAGDFNIAWDKIGVNDINANYTITFTNGSLSLEITSGYMTAYKLLRISDITFDNLETSDSWVTNLTINFDTNKDVDWYIYDRDNDDTVLISGSSIEGRDTITWKQNTARGAHQFAVKWTDGISEEWFNNSYWIYDRNIDDPIGGVPDDPAEDDRRMTIQMWATIAAVIGFFGVLSIAAVYYKVDDMNKFQLPNYPKKEQNKK